MSASSPLQALLLETPVLPVVAALLWRPFFHRQGGPTPWSTRIDLTLAVGLGLVLALVSTAWMTRYHLFVHTLTASDFSQYCNAVDAWRQNDMARWPGQRAVGAGFIAGLLGSRLGIIDALVVSATIGMVVLHASLYLWGRALSSRLGGIAASILGLSITPIVGMSRTVTFYPVIVAGFVVSAAGAALAMRYRTLPALLAAGVGVGVVLLVDVRGLLWALPAFGLGLLAVFLRASPGQGRWAWLSPAPTLPLRLAALVLPVMLSYQLGNRAFPEGHYSLEEQVVAYARDALRRAGLDERGPPSFNDVYARKDAFVWGHSSPTGIPATLGFMLEANKAMPRSLADTPEAQHARKSHVDPWWWGTVGALVVASIGLWRRPALLVVLLGGLVPFYAAYLSASTVLFHPRYLANGMVAVPMLMGVAFAVLAQGTLPGRDVGASPQRTWATLGATGTLLLLVFGVMPSWLSPRAPLRVPIAADEEPARTLSAVGTMPSPGSGLDVDCVTALGRDLAAGHPLGSALWPETYAPKEGAPTGGLPYQNPP